MLKFVKKSLKFSHKTYISIIGSRKNVPLPCRVCEWVKWNVHICSEVIIDVSGECYFTENITFIRYKEADAMRQWNKWTFLHVYWQLCWLLASRRHRGVHCSDVIMGAMAFRITSLSIVYSTVYIGADERKHQSSASLAFVRGIHRWPMNTPHKWPATRKMFPFHDVIM